MFIQSIFKWVYRRGGNDKERGKGGSVSRPHLYCLEDLICNIALVQNFIHKQAAGHDGSRQCPVGQDAVTSSVRRFLDKLNHRCYCNRIPPVLALGRVCLAVCLLHWFTRCRRDYAWDGTVCTTLPGAWRRNGTTAYSRRRLDGLTNWFIHYLTDRPTFMIDRTAIYLICY